MKPKTPEELQQWADRLGLTPSQAAKALHSSYRAYHQWVTGLRKISPPISALCFYVEHFGEVE